MRLSSPRSMKPNSKESLPLVQCAFPHLSLPLCIIIIILATRPWDNSVPYTECSCLIFTLFFVAFVLCFFPLCVSAKKKKKRETKDRSSGFAFKEIYIVELRRVNTSEERKKNRMMNRKKINWLLSCSGKT